MSRDDEIITAGAVVLFVVVLFVALGAWMNSNNNAVERQVDACLARGGTPIVTDSRGWEEFHGCATGEARK